MECQHWVAVENSHSSTARLGACKFTVESNTKGFKTLNVGNIRPVKVLGRIPGGIGLCAGFKGRVVGSGGGKTCAKDSKASY